VEEEVATIEEDVVVEEDILNAHVGKRMGHIQESCHSLHGFPDKATHASKSKERRFQVFL